MFLFSFLCTQITVNGIGFYHSNLAADDSLFIQLQDEQVAYIFSNQNLYGSIEITTPANITINPKSSGITQTLKIDVTNTTILPHKETEISVWTLPRTTCSLLSVYLNSQINMTYTTTISDQGSVCIFPLNLVDQSTVNVSFATGQSVISHAPGSNEFTETQLQSDQETSFITGTFYTVSNAGEASFDITSTTTASSSTCVSNIFKTLNGESKIVSSMSTGVSFNLDCDISTNLMAVSIETGFPTVVVVLLVILVLFCIGAGVNSCACKDKQEENIAD